MSAERPEPIDVQIDNFNIEKRLAELATMNEAELDDELFEDA